MGDRVTGPKNAGNYCANRTETALDALLDKRPQGMEVKLWRVGAVFSVEVKTRGGAVYTGDGVTIAQAAEDALLLVNLMMRKDPSEMSIEECAAELPRGHYADHDEYGWRIYQRIIPVDMAVYAYPNYYPTCLQAWQNAVERSRAEEE